MHKRILLEFLLEKEKIEIHDSEIPVLLRRVGGKSDRKNYLN